jgi:Pyridine nucleotide-disulphide oxidoreductase
MISFSEVGIVGAGPYGLSLAAHLGAAGVGFRIFGSPMETWRKHMPEGMLLKSDGVASSLYDPDDTYPLSRYCEERSIEYADDNVPVKLDTFYDYGLNFCERFVRSVEKKFVVSIDGEGGAFVLTLEGGETAFFRNVVIAVGIGDFRHVPPLLRGLPTELVSHSYQHHDLSSFAGRRVAVIGGGSSAVDLAGLLHERGCEVQLICRQEKLKFSSRAAASRTLLQHLRHPSSGLGPGWKSRFCTDAPLAFHFLPQAFRLAFAHRHLGPAAGWPMKEKIVGRVPVMTGCKLISTTLVDGGLRIDLKRGDGISTAVRADHVIAATGYQTDLRRLKFLTTSIHSRLSQINQTPILSSHFESSIRGLYFIGPAAAVSFGPLMRFAFGARYSSRRLAGVLSRAERVTLPSSTFKVHSEEPPSLAG